MTTYKGKPVNVPLEAKHSEDCTGFIYDEEGVECNGECLPESGKLRAHTPTPWRIEDEEGSPDRVHAIYGSDDTTVVETDSGVYNPNRIDAEFIVRAVNSHETLMELFEDSECYCPDNVAAKGPCAYCKVKSIAQAKKVQP